jgi:hypothetical protein
MYFEQFKEPLAELRPRTYVAAGLMIICVVAVASDPAARQIATNIAADRELWRKLLNGARVALE